MHPYTNEIFAKSLFHIGEALFVPAWKTHILKRAILIDGDIVGYDATGVYPITIFDPSIDIKKGLEFLRDAGLVSVILVLDDFHRPDMEVLGVQFSLCKKLKTHFVFYPSQGQMAYDKHHRYELRQAQKTVRAEVIDLAQHMDSWLSLYATLTDRHHLSHTHAFPVEHFKALAEMTNVVTFGAWVDDRLVSCHIWVESDGKAHSHLAASNEEGYASRAAYALNALALTHFENCSVVNFGGGAGFNDENSGLSKFKKGFSNAEANAIICGEILDKHRYNDLKISNMGDVETNFFPAYRAPKNGDKK